MQVRELADPGAVYLQLMDMASRLASYGLVHCDFNEFNILVRAQCSLHSCTDNLEIPPALTGGRV